MISNTFRGQRVALLSFAAFALAACGGGGDNAPAAASPPAPAPTSASGIVAIPAPAPLEVAIPVPPSGPTTVTVCFDSSANGTCDIGEPSTTAAANGSYTLSGIPSSQSASGQLLAAISINGAPAYTLRTSALRAEIISPITTLIQAGVAQGLTTSAAEAATARQLQLSVENLYLSSLSPPASRAEAIAMRLAEWSIVGILREGVPLSVGGGMASGDTTAARLYFTSTSTWDAHFYQRSTTYDDTTGLTEMHLLPQGLAGGAPRSAANAVPQSWSHGPRGWVPSVIEALTNHITSGNPYFVRWGNGWINSVSEREIDLSGQPIASVVQQLHGTGVVSQPSYTGINTATLAGTMPTGARMRLVRWKVQGSETHPHVSSPYLAASLTELLDNYPIPSAPDGSNTASLGAAPGANLSCTAAVCPNHNLRIAFDSATQGITYFRCDSSPTFTSVSSCATLATGNYTLGMSNDGVTPLMRITASPSTTLGGFVQRLGRVYPFAPTQSPGAGSTLRLNRVAYNALATALGIAHAPVMAIRSPYQGMWNVSYTGGEAGSCNWVLVDALGQVGGQCYSTLLRNFPLFGSVSDLGAFTTGTATDRFNGVFLPTSATGTWSQASGSATGNWSATKY